jgi:hypothetical protein
LAAAKKVRNSNIVRSPIPVPKPSHLLFIRNKGDYVLGAVFNIQEDHPHADGYAAMLLRLFGLMLEELRIFVVIPLSGSLLL